MAWQIAKRFSPDEDEAPMSLELACAMIRAKFGTNTGEPTLVRAAYALYMAHGAAPDVSLSDIQIEQRP
jgi:hypothetical protein